MPDMEPCRHCGYGVVMAVNERQRREPMELAADGDSILLPARPQDAGYIEPIIARWSEGVRTLRYRRHACQKGRR